MHKKSLNGDNLKKQLKERAIDRIYSFILQEGQVRGAFIHGTRMINEMRANHELGILETLVLGHSYIVVGLMTSNIKGNERVVFKIECDGPIKGVVAEANAFGEIRGYLHKNPIPIDKPLEDFNLTPFFGKGFLSVTKYLENAKQPFTGKIALKHGSIALDTAYYCLKSEQTPTAFNLSIQFDKNGEVIGAGGLLLQAMPGADENFISQLEQIVQGMPSIGKELSQGVKSEDFIKKAFSKYSPKILQNYRIEFFCRCNEDVIRNYMTLLSPDDLKDMAENGPFPVATKCHNCNSQYLFSKQDLWDMYKKRKNKV